MANRREPGDGMRSAGDGSGAHGSSPTDSSRGTRTRGARPQVTRYPRWVYLVLSAATVIWLLVQIVAVVIDNNHAYPVTGYSMFSRSSQGAIVSFELEATRPDGRPQPVPGEDFGLTPLQLRGYLVDEVGETPEDAHPRADDRLGDLARIWEDRHGARLAELTLWRTERHLDDLEPRPEAVATWQR